MCSETHMYIYNRIINARIPFSSENLDIWYCVCNFFALTLLLWHISTDSRAVELYNQLRDPKILLSVQGAAENVGGFWGISIPELKILCHSKTDKIKISSGCSSFNKKKNQTEKNSIVKITGFCISIMRIFKRGQSSKAPSCWKRILTCESCGDH